MAHTLLSVTLIPQCTSDKVSAGCAVPPRSAVSQEEAEGRRVPVQDTQPAGTLLGFPTLQF